MGQQQQLLLFEPHSSPVARVSDKATSQLAAAEVRPKLAGLRAEFVQRLRAIGRPATAQEIAKGKESLRKRAKECVVMRLVCDVGTKTCDVTGQRATVYWWVK